MVTQCKTIECNWTTSCPDETLADIMFLWHFYRAHWHKWCEVVGRKPPTEPDPQTQSGYALITARYGSN